MNVQINKIVVKLEKDLPSLLSPRWNEKDQLVVFGYCQTSRRGFILSDNRLVSRGWTKGRKSFVDRAKARLLNQCKTGQMVSSSLEYMGYCPIPNVDGGRYHFVYAEVQTGEDLTTFELKHPLGTIGPFGPVRTGVIRREMINRKYMPKDQGVTV